MLLNNKHYYNLPPQERKNLWKHYKKVYPNMGYTDMVKHFNGEVENYQMGGETTSSPDVTEAKDYMKDWYNSPMYKNIYQSQLKDLGMSNPKRIERVTNRAINLANQSNFNVNPTVVKDLGKYGEGSYDNKGARIIKLDKNFVENNPKLVNSLYTHELAHDNLMTAKDEEYISKNTPKFNPNLYNEQQYNILTDPEEVRSQIHSIRQLGKKNKIYDPLTQPFKKEYLDKINESYKQGTKESEDYNQVQRLRKFYSDDQITDMLNKVTKTKSTDQSVYAKHGGIIKTHQFGGRTDYFNSDVKKFADGGEDNKLSFKKINDNPIVQAAKIFDPTGISSYPDVYYAGKDFYNNPSWKNAADLGINVFGALPMIGKLAMPAKLARAAAKTTNKATGISKSVNAAIDTAPELIPFLRKPTEAVQDFTSKKFVQPFADAIKGSGKQYKAEKINAINNNVNRINLTNNLADVYSGTSSIINNKKDKKAKGGLIKKYEDGGTDKPKVNSKILSGLANNIPKNRLEAESREEYKRMHPEIEAANFYNKIQKNIEQTSEIYQSGLKKGQPTGKGALEPSYPEMMLMPGSLPIKAASKLGKAAVFAAEALNPIGGVKNLKSNVINKSASSVVENTAKQLSNSNNVASVINTIPNSWSMQELPGLHLKSTMSDGPISKIVEPKTGLINVEQALGIIGKESGGAEKLAIVKQGLGDNIPKKMDYNEFRKTVQDQLIPLERQFATHSSNYGIERLGFVPKVQGNAFERFRTVMNTGVSDFNKPRLLENQTLILGNKNKFGRGSGAHGNPEETLGHIHFLRDAETPDVLTVTQIQSDAFQGTHRIMPKTFNKEQQLRSLAGMENIAKRQEELVRNAKQIDSDTWKLSDGSIVNKSVIEQMSKGQSEINAMKKAEIENFTQKQLLDKNHQERYIQELVDYAGKRGDVNKVRVPTSETAAKVQDYQKVEIPIDKDFINPLPANATEAQKAAFDRHVDAIRKGEKPPSKIDYSSEHQTILKKYSEQPKTIKKLFGKEPKIVTDSKGNTWYEFDIPERFKKGKGEIKAFGLIAPTAILGAGALKQDKKAKQ